MSRLRVVPIVEGHGEYDCIRILLERLWYELLGGEYLEILKPIRQPSTRLKQEDGLRKAIVLAHGKLDNTPESPDPRLVLVLIDADEDCPRELGPRLLKVAAAVDTRADVSCVLANVEYETWFVAAAESLSKYLNLSGDPVISEDPEGQRHGKAWVEHRFLGRRYSMTLDQPAMTRAMDLTLCRRRSPSFDKLYRELEKRLNQ